MKCKYCERNIPSDYDFEEHTEMCKNLWDARDWM
jgi:hypothetical protein